jgi:hypothetical protein
MKFGSPENKMKFHGKEKQRKEFSDGSRSLWSKNVNNQIGSWNYIDPFAAKCAGSHLTIIL